jgi:hypothetical protein
MFEEDPARGYEDMVRETLAFYIRTNGDLRRWNGRYLKETV